MNEITKMTEIVSTNTNDDDYETMIIRRTNNLLQRFPTANFEQIYYRILNANDVDHETNIIYENLEKVCSTRDKYVCAD